VRGAAPLPDADLERQRAVVDAFVAAARGGDFDALLAALDPDVVLRVDQGAAGSHEVRGAEKVARRALLFRRLAPSARPALVNGTPGFVTTVDGRVVAVAGFTVAGGAIVEMDVLADPARLAELRL
jgi:RNA polymerase sigma-70 factor (ECF subfamily)